MDLLACMATSHGLYTAYSCECHTSQSHGSSPPPLSRITFSVRRRKPALVLNPGALAAAAKRLYQLGHRDRSSKDKTLYLNKVKGGTQIRPGHRPHGTDI